MTFVGSPPNSAAVRFTARERADHGVGLLSEGLVTLRVGKGCHLVDHRPCRDDDQGPAFGDIGGERFHPGAVALRAVQHDDDGRRCTVRLGSTGQEDVGLASTDVDAAEHRLCDGGWWYNLRPGRRVVACGTAGDK